MIVDAKIRGFICTTAHPEGCAQNVRRQIACVREGGSFGSGVRALVLGSSTGYGLASRIALAYGAGAATIGVAYDKPASANRCATAGWYNTAAFESCAAADGLYAESINGDAFSNEVKAQVIDRIRKDLGQVDVVVYSLASPVRVDPESGERYHSVIKPLGAPFTNKNIDVARRTVDTVTVEPATEEEAAATVKVMGGEDWALWIRALKDAGVLASGVKTVAYNYIGPEITHAVYRAGTIGRAKKDLEETAQRLREELGELGGNAYVSVNKALVTQASAAIPVVPLYISILFKVMKEKGLHEGCIQQMVRLFRDRLLVDQPVVEADGLIHVDDWEMREDVQSAVNAAWSAITTENLDELADVDGYQTDFYQLFGFRVPGVDYSADVDIQVEIPSIG